ncbi:MAG: RDD family protein [Candidatus Curtissbacteria bacterium]|nr:RDD family protein [Candidatus Curtissbacteria bacterium]
MQEDPNQNSSLPQVAPSVDQVQPAQTPQPVQVQTPSQPQHQITYAGFWVRLAAAIIDGILLIFPIFLVLGVIDMFLVGKLLQDNGYLNSVLGLIFVIFDVYFIIRFGATPGKMLYGLKVIRSDGSFPNIKTAILREVIGKIISGLILNLGYFWVGIDKEKQGLHDKIAGTHVILTKPIAGFQKVMVFLMGFLLVFAIPLLGILAAVVLVAVNPAKRVDQAKDSARKNDIGLISTELNSFYTVNNNRYPQTLDQLEASGSANLRLKDPLGVDYNYSVSVDGSNAAVYAFLESGTVSKNSIWCWKSSATQAQEVASPADCQP